MKTIAKRTNLFVKIFMTLVISLLCFSSTTYANENENNQNSTSTEVEMILNSSSRSTFTGPGGVVRLDYQGKRQVYYSIKPSIPTLWFAGVITITDSTNGTVQTFPIDDYDGIIFFTATMGRGYTISITGQCFNPVPCCYIPPGTSIYITANNYI